jgi:hypothetical protein
LCTGENIFTKREQESEEKTKIDNEECNNWYFITKFYKNGQIKNDTVGKVCNTRGRDEKLIKISI